MFLTVLAALVLLAQAPAAAPEASPAPAPAVSPSIGEINRLMTAWKGHKGDLLRGRLGLSTSSRTASDGEVVFWHESIESMACGVDAGGALRCGAQGGATCVLGVAFDKQGQVTNWKADGADEACAKFAQAIGEPG